MHPVVATQDSDQQEDMALTCRHFKQYLFFNFCGRLSLVDKSCCLRKNKEMNRRTVLLTKS